MFKKIGEFFKKLFSTKVETKPVVKPITTPIEAVTKPIEEVEPVEQAKEGLLTREQLNELSTSIINKYYLTVRETHGKNRSPEIDALIKRQGGGLGNAYCQFGQQDHLDELAKATGIDRRLWNYPEGGSTQTVIRAVDKKYISMTPIALGLWTIQYVPNWTGHIELIKGINTDGTLKMFGFNTSIKTPDKVVRDGEGAGYINRKFFTSATYGSQKVETRGIVDLYLIYVDAFNKKHA